MIEWVKSNFTKWGVSASFAVAALLLVTASGCTLQDWVRVAVPKPVAQVAGVEGDVYLSSVDLVWAEWESFVVRNTNAFEAADAAARERLATLETLTDLGIGAVEASIPGGAPLGGLALSALSLMTGLFLKRPGTDRVIAKEKEASFNAGLETGRFDAAEVIREARGGAE